MNARYNPKGEFLIHPILMILIWTPLLTSFHHPKNSPSAPLNVSIFEIQYSTEPSGDSPYVGQQVVTSGTVTGQFFEGFTIAEAPGAWHAVYVYTQQYAPHVGDEVQVSGTVGEYYGFTELTQITDYQFISHSNMVDSTKLDTNSAAQEAYESVLVEIGPVVVSSLEDFGEWVVQDGSGSMRVDDQNDYMYFPAIGDMLDTLSGILFFSFGDFKIEPRSTSDITGEVIPHYALRGDIVTMNAAREIILDAYVEIRGDQIVGIHSEPPLNILSISTGGLIFPGLIDAHNHPHYNLLDQIPFGHQFEDRYDWQEDLLYQDFKDQFNNILDFGGANAQLTNLFKYAEIRALASGTTTIQGYNVNGHFYDSFARQGIVINNAERFPSRVYSQVFPLRQSPSFWEEKKAENWDRFLIHLSEGTTQEALNEFYDWVNLGMLDERTTIIHGIPYSAVEWSMMAASGASLVWSPESNLRLYGSTSHIPSALAAGVNVALAPDWTESGSLSLLEELRVAQAVNHTYWGDSIRSDQLVEFVTRNAAQAIGVRDHAGQIIPGFRADLMVIDGDAHHPYDTLLNAHPSDVRLTVVNGRPMYGDAMLMVQFPFLNNLEELKVGGESKKLAIQFDAHAIPYSDDTYFEVFTTLQTAYESSDPKVCELLGLERVLTPVIYLPFITKSQ